VWLTRLDGTDVVELGTDVSGVHKRDDFSPDGQRVVFVDETTETMWTANLDGSPSVQVPGCDHDGCDNPAFSPDGTRLAYSRAESAPDVTGPAAVGIEVVDLATGEITEVVRLERPHLADVPRWSADGTQLVIGVDEMDDEANETGASIAIVPADGSAATQEPQYLTDFSLFGYTPDWSWATGEIVFSNSIKEFAVGFDPATEACDVWVIGADGTGLRQVTNVAAGEQIKGAKWRPDGAEILAFSTKVGAIRIDPATGAMTPVSQPDATGAPRQRP
jgi:Tol biopolymer transport system component